VEEEEAEETLYTAVQEEWLSLWHHSTNWAWRAKQFAAVFGENSSKSSLNHWWLVLGSITSCWSSASARRGRGCRGLCCRGLGVWVSCNETMKDLSARVVNLPLLV
jgi:hypothetical protein